MEDPSQSNITTGNLPVEGFGDLEKLCPEVRCMIYRYVLDVNLQLSEYLKGVDKYPNARYARTRGGAFGFTCGDPPVPVEKPGLPLRTAILYVNRAMKKEAIESLYTTNRFILASCDDFFYPTPIRQDLNGMRLDFVLFPLKEDLAFCSKPQYCLSDSGCLCVPTEADLAFIYQDYWMRFQRIPPDLLKSIRSLVVNFWDMENYYDDYPNVYDATWENPVTDQYPGMLDFIGSFEQIRCLRVNIRIDTMYGYSKSRMLDLVRRLSQLRKIRNLEVRAQISWSYYDINGVYECVSELPECPRAGTFYYLTKDYHKYLKEASKKPKGEEVEDFGRENVLTTTNEDEIEADTNKDGAAETGGGGDGPEAEGDGDGARACGDGGGAGTEGDGDGAGADGDGDGDGTDGDGNTAAGDEEKGNTTNQNGDKKGGTEESGTIEEHIDQGVDEIKGNSSSEQEEVSAKNVDPTEPLEREQPSSNQLDDIERALASGEIAWWYKR